MPTSAAPRIKHPYRRSIFLHTNISVPAQPLYINKLLTIESDMEEIITNSHQPEDSTQAFSLKHSRLLHQCLIESMPPHHKEAWVGWRSVTQLPIKAIIAPVVKSNALFDLQTDIIFGDNYGTKVNEFLDCIKSIVIGSTFLSRLPFNSTNISLSTIVWCSLVFRWTLSIAKLAWFMVDLSETSQCMKRFVKVNFYPDGAAEIVRRHFAQTFRQKHDLLWNYRR